MVGRHFILDPEKVFSNWELWRCVTYLFLHDPFSIWHILFNMIALSFLGSELESTWGKKKFLQYYFIVGVGSGMIAAIYYYTFNPQSLIGASGAIYGLLLAYGFTYPNRMVYLYGLFPLKVKYMVLGLGVIAFIAFLSANQSNVSHITHLSGMVIGLLFIYFNVNWKNLKMGYYKLRLKNLKQKLPTNNGKEILMKKRVDEILDKLNESGWESLTDQEEKYLTQASKELFGDRPPN